MEMEGFKMSRNEVSKTENVNDKNLEKTLSKEELSSLLMKNATDLLSIDDKLIDSQKNGWAKDAQMDGKTNETLLQPFSWNENSGVILFNDGNRTYVTKSSDEIRSQLFKSHDFHKDERIGVPGVNDGMVWKSENDWNNFKEKWNNQK